MPLWQIYHPPDLFTDGATKAAFVEDITDMYTAVGLPAFYVVVLFIPMPTENVFVGGKTKPSHAESDIGSETDKPFVRVVITHIARTVPKGNDAGYARVRSRLDKVVNPHLLDRGYDVEYHVHETERQLWKINGLVPPPYQSAEEQIWVRENRAVPYPGSYPPSTAASD
jgi:phenylpyruvate tautomerase PptA (4-oxalocrotonate tautomerase family)